MIVSIHEAKSQLSKLIQAVLEGEEVIIAKGKKPIAQLVPVQAQPDRVLGLGEGKAFYMAEDFDAPLDDFADYME